MLVFSEGVPRAGKSYDAVKNHILPALAAGRHVFARLNGLDLAAIAAYLKLPESRIQSLLHLVETDAVLETFACSKGEGGRWVIPDQLKNALCVIDEVHEFYVQSRAPLPPEQENFFALIGQNGGDVLIITQWIKRVHPAVRARIERKNTFQKLSAVGSDKSYRVTYYQTIGPDKFEKIGGSTEKYDPAIFPLYHGYAPGADNVEVYKSGGTTVWRQLAPKLLIFGMIGIAAVGFLMSFFSGDGAKFASDDKIKATNAQTSPGLPPGVYQPADPLSVEAVKETFEQKQKRERVERLEALTPGQRYVIELASKGRVRLAARAGFGGMDHVIVEWLNDQGVPVERLTGAALRDLGYLVESRPFGVLLTAGTESIVATQWPLTMVVREAESRLYNLAADQPAASMPSEASHAGGGPAPIQPIASYGGMREP